MNKQERFYQPPSTKAAMRKIQELFNPYCKAPLNNELVSYHLKLVNQLKTNLIPLIKEENNPTRIQLANQMVKVMEDWLKIRLANRPYPGKMKHFNYVADADVLKYKRHAIKLKNQSNLRSSRH